MLGQSRKLKDFSESWKKTRVTQKTISRDLVLASICQAAALSYYTCTPKMQRLFYDQLNYGIFPLIARGVFLGLSCSLCFHPSGPGPSPLWRAVLRYRSGGDKRIWPAPLRAVFPKTGARGRGWVWQPVISFRNEDRQATRAPLPSTALRSGPPRAAPDRRDSRNSDWNVRWGYGTGTWTSTHTCPRPQFLGVDH